MLPIRHACALLISLVIVLGLATAVQAADPVTFQEISLLVRTGQTSQEIVNETARRKLLGPLTAEQETALRAQGASAALLTALRTPSLLATPEEVAAYTTRRSAAPLISPGQPSSPAARRTRQPLIISNPFPAGLEAAKKGAPRVMKITDAYRLDELPKAKARAQAERKPLGFIMVWDSMFTGKAYSSRTPASNAGLVHFYEAFKDSLVLVFARHESDLQNVPDAVKAGFFGPDEGGYAPNMAVVDATATELIIEIPLGGVNATGAQRDVVFQGGADRIYQWLTYHPTACADPPLPR